MKMNFRKTAPDISLHYPTFSSALSGPLFAVSGNPCAFLEIGKPFCLCVAFVAPVVPKE